MKEEYTGRKLCSWIYFKALCPRRKKEEQLYKKYNDKLIFVSVCTDDDSLIFKSFLKQNPAYKWAFLYGGKNKKLAEQYNLKSLPIYYLISPDGYLLQSPASKPDEGIEFKFNQIFKIKNKTPSVGK